MATTQAQNNGHTAGIYKNADDGGERLPPYNQDAEEALLGSLMIDPGRFSELTVTSQMFFIGYHRVVFECMTSLTEEGKALDFVTISAAMESKGEQDIARLVGLLNVVPTSTNIHDYAFIVQDRYNKRRAIRQASKLANDSFDQERDLQEILASTLEALRDISGDSTEGDPVSSYQAAGKTLEQLSFRRENKEAREKAGLSTGFIDLDRILQGLESGSLGIIAGRPGTGKSTLEQAIRTNVAKQGKRVVAFSLEMSIEQMIVRMLSARLKVPYKTISMQPHLLSDQHWTLMQTAIGEISEYKMHLDDSPSLSISELEAKAHKLAATHGQIDLLTVDYVQLMSGRKNTPDRVKEIGQITRGLKALAKELNTRIIALAQVNRSVEHRAIKKPILSDLRESGDMEQDANWVGFLYREALYNPDTERVNIAELDIAKHRNGPLGQIDLFFDGAMMLFKSLARADVDF